MAPNKLFEDRLWHGKAMYQCLKCPWSTLNCVEMEKHAADHLREERKKTRYVDTGLISPSGSKIVREEELSNGTVEEEGYDGN